MKYLIMTSFALTNLIAGQAQAQIFEDWVGEASLSGSKTTGNTETTDIGFGLKLDKVGETWTHKFNAAADLGEAKDDQGVNITNKKRYNLGYQIDRELNERTYVYGNADYFSDDFGPFQEGYFLGTGFGYKALTEAPVTWSLEGGIGYREQQAQGALGARFDEVAGRIFSDFDWVLNDNVSAYNDTEVIFADSNTNIWNEIGLTAQIAGNLAARMSFRVDHNTDVPVGIENTDTISRVGIVYTIK